MEGLPSFLAPFKADIEKYGLESVKIVASPRSEGKEALGIMESKFLGHAYWPLGKEYPMAKDGNPMILLAQINFQELPPLENYPTGGILQLFVSPFTWYDMDDYQVVFHENTSLNHLSDFSFLSEKLYEESPIYCEHQLSFKKEIEYGGVNDFRWGLKFNGLDYFDYQETLSKAQQEQMDQFFYGSGHKIGGYAFFTQTDPRDYGRTKKKDVLLLQIDTDEEIMFGDSGVANVFINIDELINRNFEKAYFNWDCC